MFILAGCRSPAVLRSVAKTNDGNKKNGQETEGGIEREKQANKYHFVGLCFMDGLMYGEAESRHLPWQSLELY